MMGTMKRAVLACLLMLVVTGAGFLFKPTLSMATQRGYPALEKDIPKQFGDWRIDPMSSAYVIDPQQAEGLRALYTDTLSRTYINSRGQRVMLSVAYGDDQMGEKSQVHRPEICYTAQGFQIRGQGQGSLALAHGSLQINRLIGSQGPRNEPISYWVTVGDKAVLPGLERKLAQLSYSVHGVIPDGLLFRVSSIGDKPDVQFNLQNDFLNALYYQMQPNVRSRYFGAA